MTHPRLARLALVGRVLLLAADASAQSIEVARSAFADGRFLEAADLGEALGTSDGYTQAAQSLAVCGMSTRTTSIWTSWMDWTRWPIHPDSCFPAQWRDGKSGSAEETTPRDVAWDRVYTLGDVFCDPRSS